SSCAYFWNRLAHRRALLVGNLAPAAAQVALYSWPPLACGRVAGARQHNPVVLRTAPGAHHLRVGICALPCDATLVRSPLGRAGELNPSARLKSSQRLAHVLRETCLRRKHMPDYAASIDDIGHPPWN